MICRGRTRRRSSSSRGRGEGVSLHGPHRRQTRWPDCWSGVTAPPSPGGDPMIVPGERCPCSDATHGSCRPAAAVAGLVHDGRGPMDSGHRPRGPERKALFRLDAPEAPYTSGTLREPDAPVHVHQPGPPRHPCPVLSAGARSLIWVDPSLIQSLAAARAGYRSDMSGSSGTYLSFT